MRCCDSLGTWGLALMVFGCTGANTAKSEASLGAPPVVPRQGADSARWETARAPRPSEVGCVGGDDEMWTAGSTTACNSHCSAESVLVSRCIDQQREERLLRAPCECGPTELSSELAGCALERLSLVPREEVPRSAGAAIRLDGCKLELKCLPGKLSVSCDGEEDGTESSLCECSVDGQTLRLPGKPWPGEGAATCHAAAAVCLKLASAPARNAR